MATTHHPSHPDAGSPLLDRLLAAPVVASAAAPLDDALAAASTGTAGVVHGLHGSATSLLVAAWYRRRPRTALLVAPTRQTALQLADDLEVWLGERHVVYLPQPEVLPFDRQSPDPELVGSLLWGLTRLAGGEALIGVTSLAGVRQRILAPRRLAEATVTLRVGDRLERDELCRRLDRMGYAACGMTARVGEYARRGSLVDVFAPGGDPVRIEYFDDEILSLRRFDPASQRSVGKLESVTILPVSHLYLDDDAVLSALAAVEEAAAAGALPEDERIELEERIEDRLHGTGLEAWLPLFGPTALPLDYLPEGAPLLWWDPEGLAEQAVLQERELPASRSTRLERDPWLPAVEELVAPLPELAAGAGPHVLLAGGWLGDDPARRWLDLAPATVHDAGTRRPDLKGGDVAALAGRLCGWEKEGWTSVVLCDNAGQADRLADLLLEQEGPVPSRRPEVGRLAEGFLWPALPLAVVTDHEFFQRYQRVPRRRHRGAAVVREAVDLQPGDYVVHVEYGIGRYHGLRRVTAEGVERECLYLEYDGGDKVYVPVEKIDLVERYSSDQDSAPALSRLGSAAWARVTKRARKAIRAMAAELLELYAARRSHPGFAFPPDGELMRSLEASFIHEETPDQLQAIADVKQDMESPVPMDRLVCGDVGFGKTEVAMRAAFKAVESGKQVVVLCPTTLLAHQHGETFAERFRDFPVRLAVLSRFQSPARQREIVRQAREGELDILIGTHRLLSRDVKLKDLGLLIIDEEHRFGVRHKERLKRLRREVDVLSLSATPIPRTLYLSLMGARDMSLITTPPRNRLPVQTEICSFDERILKEAILRELHRGGQVFFVHNRIETIEGVAALLRRLLPEVRVCVAHGRLPEEKLEEVMRRFLAHEYDVLVTTTIIESGLDMPRVNTIIIDRADRFGLAQLYQIRGRVGRSSQRAFAYLMTPPGERLTRDARRRLAALQEFQALGSGYHVAVRDLEIRGAGNILGEEQSGHLEAIGFDLYCRLLEEAVAELKGGARQPLLDIRVDLKLPAYLPDDYVGDAQQKMELYRRLNRITELRGFRLLRDELHDRFGPPPPPVLGLLDTYRVRLLAARNGVEEVRCTRRGVELFFASGREPSPAIIRSLMGTGPKGLMFKAVDQLVMQVPASREQAPAAAVAMLDLLERLREATQDDPPAAPGQRTKES